MRMSEIVDMLQDYNDIVKMYDLPINVWKLSDHSYYIHKKENGSYRRLRGDEYFDKMTERWDYVSCKINHSIEDLIDRRKKYEIWKQKQDGT